MSNERLAGNVYLYQRFSSSAQEGNSSLYRQGAAQQDWLSRNPDCVIAEISGQPLIDAGVSAFSGKHLESGSLGRLVAAIESKVVAKGSIILVEHFSRLSRMSITNTGKLLDKIWDHDITIVTARDNAIYSPEKRDDMATRMRLIVEIDKAHSDSKWRSEKVKSSWLNRERKARDEDIPPRMRMPFWLDKHGKLNEYADVVRDIFKLHAEGLGQVLIERQLRKKYGDIKPLINVNPTKIIRIIQNEKCIGRVYGKPLFDAVIEDQIFYNAQRICKERLYTSVREDRKWPLHGLVKCGSCGSGMSIQQTAKSLPLLRCSRKQRSGGEYCEASATFPYVVAYHFFKWHVEGILLALMSDLKRNDKAEKEKLEITHKLKELNSRFIEVKNVYSNRVEMGKKAFSSLNIMDDIKEEIDELSDQLSIVQNRIEISKKMTSISSEILKLCETDSPKYNLELNKLGFKIYLKNKELSFSLNDNEKIAILRYIKYDRKRNSYKIKFIGDENYFKNGEYSDEIRSMDWSIERLLKPRTSVDNSPQSIATFFHESFSFSDYIPSLKVSLRD